MDSFLQMNVFFFLASVGLVIFFLLISLILLQIWRILRTIEHISTMVSEEGEEIRANLKEVRERIREEGLGLKNLLRLLTLTSTRTRSKKRKTDA